jgi:hypothetical protein
MLALALALLLAGPADDDDLDRIPADEPTAHVTAAANGSVDARAYAEDALTLTTARDVVVPFPQTVPRAQNRTSLDLSLEWSPLAALSFVASDRVDVVVEDGTDVLSSQTIRNELRELYLGWEAVPGTYLELGRINVRNGAALGYNPTDFFRARTLIGQPSLDPSVLRSNRLGTVVVRAQTIWNGASASLTFAPKLGEPPAIPGDVGGLDPRIDATNAAHRGLAEASFAFGDLSTQALVYLEDEGSKVGIDLTYPFGRSVIGYLEWAGGPEKSLVARALEYGTKTGSLPAGTRTPIPTDGGEPFMNDLAAGGSWTIGTTLTLNLEYHFHQAGLSAADWDRWFDAGRANPAAAGALWYIRGHAAAELEPLAMHEAFVRAAWPHFVVDHLELDGLAFVSLVDGSTLAQLTARLDVSNTWSATLSLSANVGPAHSERGSFPQAFTSIFELVWYL